MNYRIAKHGASWLALVLALAGAACSREQVKENVNDAKRVGDDVEQSVRDGVESAKQGAEKVKQELPAATERAKQELSAVGKEVQEKVEQAKQAVKREKDALDDKK